MKHLSLILSALLISVSSMAQMYIWQGGRSTAANIDSITFSASARADSAFIVTPSKMELTLGKTDRIALVKNAFPISAYTWASSNEGVATIDAQGNITTIAEGVTILSATSGLRSQTCILTVYQVASLETTPTSALMYVGSQLQLEAIVEPADTKVTWESEDMNTATVDANGLVTAKAAGECKVFAVSGTLRAATKIQIFNNPVTCGLEIMDVTQKKCTVAVTPSDEEGYYYCGYADKASLGNITDAELAENVMTNLKAMAEQYAAYGYTLKSFLQQGTKNLIASSLTASTDYVMFAFGVDVENEKEGPVVTRAEFKTKDVVPSNMTITLQFDSASYVENSKGTVDTLIYFSAHPSTESEAYLLGGAEKTYLTQKFNGDPETYMKNVEANYDKNGTLEKYLRKGVFSIYAENPEDNSQWVIIAAGYEGGFTTKMFTLEYTYVAPKSGKPARLVPRTEVKAIEMADEVSPIQYIPGMCH